MATLASDIPKQGANEDATDAALAAAGDTQAFERLYRRHAAKIHTLARRMLAAEEDAADATQEVFVRTWQKLALFRGESAFGTWLHRLAINVILARRAALATHRDRYGSDFEAVEYAAPAGPSAETRLDFEAALTTLPDGAREVFVLHDVEGYKHEEIGRLLGISAGTSKSQLHRARMTLRKHLEK